MEMYNITNLSVRSAIAANDNAFNSLEVLL